MNISDKILDETVRHQIGLQGYKRRVVGKIIAMVKDVHDTVAARLIREDLQGMGVRDLNRLLASLEKTVKLGYEPVKATLEREIKELVGYERGFQLDMFKAQVPINLDFQAPSMDQIYAATKARPFQGYLLKDWVGDLDAKAFGRIKAAIREGYTDGRTTGQIVRSIIGSRTQKGIVDISRRGAEATVRTALAHTANVARSEVYKRNTSRIEAVQWVSTLDSRTTFICMARDGQRYPVDSGPRPPAHWNCRSTTIPILKSWRKLGLTGLPSKTRASMDGQVPSDLTYDQWLRTKGAAFQDDVLGRTKGKLFRNGMSVAKFVDRAGSERTLDQLRASDAAAFAGL